MRERFQRSAHYIAAKGLRFSGEECFAILPPLGLVAQSVEQRIENPCVGGSIPPRATKKAKPSLAITGAFFVRADRIGWRCQRLCGITKY